MIDNILKQTVCESDKLSKSVLTHTPRQELAVWELGIIWKDPGLIQSLEYDLYPDLHVELPYYYYSFPATCASAAATAPTGLNSNPSIK